MKNCFKSTRGHRHRHVHERDARVQPGPRRRGHVRRRRAASGRGRRPHREAHRRRLPRRRRSASASSRATPQMKAWVDSRLALMKQKDQFLPILKAQRPAAVRARVLEEHPAAEQHVRVRGRRARRAWTRCARRRDVREAAAASRGRLPAADAMLLATYDLWAFVSENWRRALARLRQHAQGLGDRDRRLVRDRARRSAPRAPTASRS